ncbi:MAG: dihydrofolate reductase family protein [Anaerolineae bacterium]
MGKLIYSALSSLDGYIEDEGGQFDWAVPSDEVHAFINDLTRPVGTHLYGRRMYEVMRVWETEPSLAEQSPVMADFARLWQAADKVVFSRTLQAVSTSRTRLEREFEPDAIRQMKAREEQDLVIGGPTLATIAFRAGLVDECQLFLAPISVGGGKRSLPIGLHLHLDLVEQRQFRNGMVYVRYLIKKRG